MLPAAKLLTTSLLITTALACSYASFSFAQDDTGGTQIITQEYRPTWGNIPSVKRPAFSYGEVQNSKLIAEAGQSLDFLSIDNLVIGSITTNGKGGAFQVIGPDGNVFYVDNIAKPKCAVIAQYVEGTNKIGQSNNIVSNVYIEEVNFRNCN